VKKLAKQRNKTMKNHQQKDKRLDQKRNRSSARETIKQARRNKVKRVEFIQEVA